jgi:hypothetical protein
MQRNVRSINLRLSLALAEHGIVRDSLPDLHLNKLLGEVRYGGLRIRTKPQNVGIVELHFRTPAIARRNLVAHYHGLIQNRR